MEQATQPSATVEILKVIAPILAAIIGGLIGAGSAFIGAWLQFRRDGRRRREERIIAITNEPLEYLRQVEDAATDAINTFQFAVTTLTASNSQQVTISAERYDEIQFEIQTKVQLLGLTARKALISLGAIKTSDELLQSIRRLIELTVQFGGLNALALRAIRDGRYAEFEEDFKGMIERLSRDINDTLTQLHEQSRLLRLSTVNTGG